MVGRKKEEEEAQNIVVKNTHMRQDGYKQHIKSLQAKTVT